MRTTGKAALAAIAVFGIGLTGCSGDNAKPGAGTSAGASGVARPPRPGHRPPAAPAARGWSGRRGAVPGRHLEGERAHRQAQRPGQRHLHRRRRHPATIDSAGKAQVDFGAMQPVTFTFTVSGGDVKGSFGYGGKVNGTVKTPRPPPARWEPTGTVDFSTLTVTVDLTSPAAVRVADKTSITDFAGTGTADTGGAVDAQPVLKKSQLRLLRRHS